MLTTLRVISKSPPKKRAQNAQQSHDKRKHNAKEWQLHRCLPRNTAVQPRNRPWEINPGAHRPGQLSSDRRQNDEAEGGHVTFAKACDESHRHRQKDDHRVVEHEPPQSGLDERSRGRISQYDPSETASNNEVYKG